MGYYCTVPQCTSLAGKTKSVKFHRFPRDEAMADKWNLILKRGKPYTKYSKVCSLHFTQNDYNVTNMGQWKTLSKDAVPSQNLPKLNPDGTVMVIRKSRTLKYKDRKDESVDKPEKWSPIAMSQAPPSAPLTEPVLDHDSSLAYRLQTLHALATGVSPISPQPLQLKPSGLGSQPDPQSKPKKQDAFMQTDPVQSEEEENTQPNNSYSETSDNSYHSQHSQSEQMGDYPVQYKEPEKSYESKSYESKSYEAKSYESKSYEAKSYESKSYDSKSYEPPKDYTKQNDDYIPQTDEEYNKEAEKYALGQKSLNGYDKEYQKSMDYQKMGQIYTFSEKQEFRSYYPNGYTDSADVLRNQQANLQILQQQHRLTENQNFFTEGIKQEVDLSGEDMYDRTKEAVERDVGLYESQRRLAQHRPLEINVPLQVKQEPEGCESVMQPQGSPYGYSNGLNSVQGYYEQVSRPGPEMLIAKQNALAAHTQLWQNTMKRPFFYSESPHYNGPPLLHRYEDIPRILQ